MLYTKGPMMGRIRMQLAEAWARVLVLHPSLQAKQMLYTDELMMKRIRKRSCCRPGIPISGGMKRAEQRAGRRRLGVAVLPCCIPSSGGMGQDSQGVGEDEEVGGCQGRGIGEGQAA